MAALSNQALALISISCLILSIFTVEAQLATPPSPSPTNPRSFISSTPTSSPSPSPSVSPSEKAQLAKYIELNMNGIAYKIDEFSTDLKMQLEYPETTLETKECIEKCTDLYDAAKEDTINSIEDIVSGNLYKATFDISSVSTNVDACEQCFDEVHGEDHELYKFGDWVRGITDDCLSALNTVAS